MENFQWMHSALTHCTPLRAEFPNVILWFLPCLLRGSMGHFFVVACIGSTEVYILGTVVWRQFDDLASHMKDSAPYPILNVTWNPAGCITRRNRKWSGF